MSEEVRIGNDRSTQLVLDQPRVRADGWLESYRVRLDSQRMNAEVTVDNATYGERLVGFFGALDAKWKGWEGARTWRAIEGEYELSATISRTGHVTLTACLHVYPCIWEATAKFNVEAGQLEALANEIRKFFKQEQR